MKPATTTEVAFFSWFTISLCSPYWPIQAVAVAMMIFFIVKMK